MNDYDKSQILIINRNIALSIQGGMIYEYQSTRKHTSSLLSMIEERCNNQGMFSHQEGHGLDVLINKGASKTLCHCSILQATHHLL